MVMFFSTPVLAQSKDCLEMGILSDSSEKITIESEVSQQEVRNREIKVIFFIKGIFQDSTNV